MNDSRLDNASPAALLDWDSAYFGCRIGRVRGDRLDPSLVQAIDHWTADESIDLLYFLARSDCPATVRTAEEAGYRLVDIRVTLARPVPPGLVPDADARPARSADLDPLRPLCRAGFREGRFHADGHFDPALCDAFYVTWLENSLAGFADATWVIEREGVAAGFITCHADHDNGRGSIGLVGVTESARGGGYGRRLVRQALAWASAQGLTSMSVVTQGRNVAAQRLYQREAFLTSSVGLWYHKWFVSPGSSL
jgi:ribosomal protein S18 acetylase RimI-like enzyme